MRLLSFLSQVFINTFGITQPSEEQRRRVSILLGGFILAVLLLAFALMGFLVYQVHRGR